MYKNLVTAVIATPVATCFSRLLFSLFLPSVASFATGLGCGRRALGCQPGSYA